MNLYSVDGITLIFSIYQLPFVSVTRFGFGIYNAGSDLNFNGNDFIGFKSTSKT